ncbi:4-oxalocrotonate tautomerase [Ruminococcaceae bacterium KH2T8]|nr:4-oxalocrotonate tautomerase [Ruminococcaceae bacterium KH2T8]
MPHVVIKCFPGRSEEVKQACADKVAADVAEALGVNLSSVSVAIKEVPKEEWKCVFDNEIMASKDELYKEPGYTCD